MVRALITGSTGFLGTKLAEQFSNEFELCTTSLHDQINPIDMLDEQALRTLFESFNPDVVIHTAAIVDSSIPNVREVNNQGTQNVVNLARNADAAIVFTSSESVYGGKEQTGNYVESDPYKPRSAYGQTRVDGEQIVIASGQPFLITRAHRYVGVSPSFKNPKQFPDTMAALQAKQPVHLDASKIFRPCLINNLAEIFRHFIANHITDQTIINVGIREATTYSEFVSRLAMAANLDTSLIYPDGDEAGWPHNSALCVDHATRLGYPICGIDDAITTIASELNP